MKTVAPLKKKKAIYFNSQYCSTEELCTSGTAVWVNAANCTVHLQILEHALYWDVDDNNGHACEADNRNTNRSFSFSAIWIGKVWNWSLNLYENKTAIVLSAFIFMIRIKYTFLRSRF
jgi:hypothetical protein